MCAYEISVIVVWVISLFFIPAIAEHISQEDLDLSEMSSWVACAVIAFLLGLLSMFWVFIATAVVSFLFIFKVHTKFIKPRIKK